MLNLFFCVNKKVQLLRANVRKSSNKNKNIGVYIVALDEPGCILHILCYFMDMVLVIFNPCNERI